MSNVVKSFFAASLCVTTLMAFCAEDEVLNRLDTYQNAVRAQMSGVYQIGDDLYVHVRMPVSKRDSKSRMAAKAMLSAKEKLLRWCIDYSSSSRIKNTNAVPQGVATAVRVLNDANAQWRFREWEVQLNGQESMGKDKDGFWYGQILKVDDVVRQIPQSFYEPYPSTNQLFCALRKFIPLMLNEKPLRVYGCCGVLDIDGAAEVDETVRKEHRALDERLRSYLETNSYPAEVRISFERLRTPKVANEWIEQALEPVVSQSESICFQTNRFAEIKVVTNIIVRVESDHERDALGVSEKGVVTEETRISDEEEIVETRTETTETTVKRIRTMKKTLVSGNPRFEEIFLSGGILENKIAVQTPLGAAAAKAYHEGILPLEEIEKMVKTALRENPGDVQMWNMYGNIRVKRDDLFGALICFRCAIKLAPDNEYALTNLYLVYQRLNCPNLSIGYGVLALGVGKDPWCLMQVEIFK